MTTFTIDGETQTEHQFVRALETQTPRSNQLYLPNGVTITRLVDPSAWVTGFEHRRDIPFNDSRPD
jgi:hypothetical protein